jgi:hypothetical protein
MGQFVVIARGQDHVVAGGAQAHAGTQRGDPLIPAWGSLGAGRHYQLRRTKALVPNRIGSLMRLCHQRLLLERGSLTRLGEGQ